MKEPEEATSSDKTKEDEQVTGSEVKNEDPEPKGEQSSEKARVTGAEASAEQEYQKPKFNRFRTSKIDECESIASQAFCNTAYRRLFLYITLDRYI